MTSLRNNFNFCADCYQEGNRFLKVTDAQKEELNKYYQTELKKKDTIISSLRNSFEIQHQFDHSSISDLRKEHEDFVKKLRMQHAEKVDAMEANHKSLEAAWEEDVKQIRQVLEEKIEECITLQEIHALEMENKKLEINVLKKGLQYKSSKESSKQQRDGGGGATATTPVSKEMEELKKAHNLEIIRLKHEHMVRMNDLMSSNVREIVSQLESKHKEEMLAKEREIEVLKLSHEIEIDELIDDHLKEVNNLVTQSQMMAESVAGHHSGGGKGGSDSVYRQMKASSSFTSTTQQENAEQKETLRRFISTLELKKKHLAMAAGDLQELAADIADSTFEEETQSKMIVYNATKQVVQRLMDEVGFMKRHIAAMQNNNSEGFQQQRPQQQQQQPGMPPGILKNATPRPMPMSQRNAIQSPFGSSPIRRPTPPRSTTATTTQRKTPSSSSSSSNKKFNFGSPLHIINHSQHKSTPKKSTSEIMMSTIQKSLSPLFDTSNGSSNSIGMKSKISILDLSPNTADDDDDDNNDDRENQNPNKLKQKQNQQSPDDDNDDNDEENIILDADVHVCHAPPSHTHTTTPMAGDLPVATPVLLSPLTSPTSLTSPTHEWGDVVISPDHKETLCRCSFFGNSHVGGGGAGNQSGNGGGTTTTTTPFSNDMVSPSQKARCSLFMNHHHHNDNDSTTTHPSTTPRHHHHGMTPSNIHLSLSPARDACWNFIDPMGAPSPPTPPPTTTTTATATTTTTPPRQQHPFNFNNDDNNKTHMSVNTTEANAGGGGGGGGGGGDGGVGPNNKTMALSPPRKNPCENVCWDFFDPMGAAKAAAAEAAAAAADAAADASNNFDDNNKSPCCAAADDDDDDDDDGDDDDAKNSNNTTIAKDTLLAAAGAGAGAGTGAEAMTMSTSPIVQTKQCTMLAFY